MSLDPESWFIGTLKAHGDPSDRQWDVHGGDVVVTEEEVKEIREALDMLKQDVEQRDLNLVLDHFKRFFDVALNAPSRFESRTGGFDLIQRLTTELTTRLFDWLGSFRAYVDHVETRLNRTYGKDSEQFRAFKNVAGRCFDEHLGYRFLSKLRNFGHVDFPVLHVNIDEVLNADGSRTISFSMCLDRDALLAGFDGWGALVRRELGALADCFPFEDMMVTVMDCLRSIQAVVAAGDRERLEHAFSIIQSARAKVADKPGSPRLVRLGRKGGLPTSFEMIPLPEFMLGTGKTGDV